MFPEAESTILFQAMVNNQFHLEMAAAQMTETSQNITTNSANHSTDIKDISTASLWRAKEFNAMTRINFLTDLVHSLEVYFHPVFF